MEVMFCRRRSCWRVFKLRWMGRRAVRVAAIDGLLMDLASGGEN